MRDKPERRPRGEEARAHLYPYLSRPERVEEEEEFPDGRARIEVVKGLFQTIQLRQSVNQLCDVVLQVLFPEIGDGDGSEYLPGSGRVNLT